MYSSTAIRDTQRVPRRCLECARRRVRCSKTIPCGPCISRKIAHECAREVVSVKGTVRIAVDSERRPASDQASNLADLARENSVLQARISQLEVALALQHDARFRPDGGHVTPVIDGVDSERQEKLDLIENVESIFQDWSIGRKGDGEDAVPPSVDTAWRGVDMLPPRDESDRIVFFALRNLGWIHCALNVNQFVEEYISFWNAIESRMQNGLPGHAWMALFYSVLTTGYFFVDVEDSTPVMVGSDPSAKNITAVRHWYAETSRELGLSDFLGKPSLQSIQAIVILTLCSGNLGEFERDFVLHGAANHAAMALGMHRLGSEATFNQSGLHSSLWADRATRELGRRLWWTLVICDWLGNFTRPSSISPSSFDCVLRKGPYDKDILLGWDVTEAQEPPPSPLDHHIMMAKLSYIVYVYVKANRSYSPGNIGKAMREIENLRKCQLPTHLCHDAVPTERAAALDQQYPWIRWQRYQLHVAIELTYLNMCRLGATHTEKHQDHKYFRDRAIKAARNIAWIGNWPVLPMFEKTWSVSAAMMAAGTYLGINLLTQEDLSNVDIDEHRHIIALCVAKLQKFGGTTIVAQKGHLVLQYLLQVQTEWAGNGSRSLRDTIEAIYTLTKNHHRESQPIGARTGSPPGEGTDNLNTNQQVHAVTTENMVSELFFPFYNDALTWSSSAEQFYDPIFGWQPAQAFDFFGA